MYLGAQNLLRTENEGLTWTEISGDLTRNQIERQGPGGGPFTNEAAGGENYNTIMYISLTTLVIYFGFNEFLFLTFIVVSSSKIFLIRFWCLCDHNIMPYWANIFLFTMKAGIFIFPFFCGCML